HQRVERRGRASVRMDRRGGDRPSVARPRSRTQSRAQRRFAPRDLRGRRRVYKREVTGQHRDGGEFPMRVSMVRRPGDDARLVEYDARIRTFIPDYEEMLASAGACVPRDARTIVDLGIGTGALAARCLLRARRAIVVGVDADAAMLELAARRLRSRVQVIADD